MARQSFSVTEPNDAWLKAQVQSKEYSSKSEVVNDLIRRARNQAAELEYLRERLALAEKSGFTSMGQDEILRDIKSSMDGGLSS